MFKTAKQPQHNRVKDAPRKQDAADEAVHFSNNRSDQAKLTSKDNKDSEEE